MYQNLDNKYFIKIYDNKMFKKQLVFLQQQYMLITQLDYQQKNQKIYNLLL